jgi:hypothetical protein
VINQTYVMFKWTDGDNMDFHKDYAISCVEHQGHLLKDCHSWDNLALVDQVSGSLNSGSHTLKLLQTNSDLQKRQDVELELELELLTNSGQTKRDI